MARVVRHGPSIFWSVSPLVYLSKIRNAGFKAFRREATLPIFQRQTIMGFGFDPEILYIREETRIAYQGNSRRWNHVDGQRSGS